MGIVPLPTVGFFFFLLEGFQVRRANQALVRQGRSWSDDNMLGSTGSGMQWNAMDLRRQRGSVDELCDVLIKVFEISE